MKEAWLNIPERSSLFWMHAITWIALKLGRGVAWLLLYPITAYFLLFANQTGGASVAYLRRILGRAPKFAERFRHYHTFACTLLDRLYVLAGQDQRLDIKVHGLELLERHARSGQGCILVGAHLGSFEIVRAVGRLRSGFKVKALMHGERTPLIAGLYRRLNPGLHEDIVDMGNPASLLGLDGYIAAGGCVALLGDRAIHGDKRVLCDFLGAPAYFPQAPALLGHILQAPLLLFVCLHRGWGRYEVYFETLTEEPPRLPRKAREAAVREIMQRYAGRLEHYCRLAPYNWFNFHDFWRIEA
jgi:predicted LPLAT superfamily acyltransferase